MAERSKMHGPRVNNKKLIRKLAFKTVKANSRKNIVIIAAIALCTFMFTSLFTIGLSLVSKFQESTQRQSGGSSDASFKYLTEAEYDAIAADTRLKEVCKRICVGDAVNTELIKCHTEVNYCDVRNAHKSFCYPEVGQLEAVGMTKSMQRKIIKLEGLIYGGLAAICGTVLSTLFSLILIKGIGAEMWFYTYRFALIPMVLIVPVLIIVAVIIPEVIYKISMKETVVEKLRLAEA